MDIIKITPHSFYKKLRKMHYGLRHSMHLTQVLKRYGHCYTLHGLYTLENRRA
jgi:hypothetical protein